MKSSEIKVNLEIKAQILKLKDNLNPLTHDFPCSLEHGGSFSVVPPTNFISGWPGTSR